MRQLRYSVAASLDGFIAGPNGEFDWVVVDPEIDFAEMYAGFSALVMGRGSYDVFVSTGSGEMAPNLPIYVYSRTLPEGTRDGVTFVTDGAAHVRALKAERGGKPIWLWGGGTLFRELADARLVDAVDVAIIPVVLGGGLPLIAPGSRLSLTLRSHRLYAATGTLMLGYDVASQGSNSQTPT